MKNHDARRRAGKTGKLALRKTTLRTLDFQDRVGTVRGGTVLVNQTDPITVARPVALSPYTTIDGCRI